MIVIDTSALVSIYRREEGRAACEAAITKAPLRLIPVSAFVEFALLQRIGTNRMAWLREAMVNFAIELQPIEAAMADVAAGAAERYGRGGGHRARLNFGDCLSYAVAKHLNAPLLYKGGDFRYTDIESALPP